MEKGRFPNKLKLYRCAAGYSQKKVAQMLGLYDTARVSRWERGMATPNVSQLFSLALIYDTQPQRLYEMLWQLLADSLLAQHEPHDKY